MIHEALPDLGPIAARAITEVLATQLNLPTRESALVEWPIAGQPEQSLIGSVKLTGSRVSGDVHVQLPDGFVAKVTGLLLGRTAADAEEAADITGELCNMLAGRVAADLAAAGYSSILSTPKVSRGRRLEPEIAPGAQTCRSDWISGGHLLTVMLQIIFRSI
jgi:CheY-specific phosphatase CheX